MTSSPPTDRPPDLLGRLGSDVEREESSRRAEAAAAKIGEFTDPEYQVGDLIRMDFDEAHILVHDALRLEVGGVPHGCLLVAAKPQPSRDEPNEAVRAIPSLLLLRVVGTSTLPNDIEMQQARFQAGQRASDSPHNWDENQNTDQFTLHQMRYAGLHCSILGTFRMVPADDSDDWRLAFGSDIDNFYAGQGMKIYKPVGEALERIVNFTREGAAENGRVQIGEIRYAAALDGGRPESVPVRMTTRDVIAQRTALFGMTRTGKSNTVKTLATAVFKLRLDADGAERVAQLIIDPNGEYANDNPQDDGCLRNVRLLDGVDAEDVVTYGLTTHPNDPERHITRMNFFGQDLGPQPPNVAAELDAVLQSLYMGRQVIDGRLNAESAAYIGAFRATDMTPPPGVTERGEYVRYRRALFVYQAVLAAAGFEPPRATASARGLFGAGVREAMENDALLSGFASQLQGELSWDAAAEFCRQLSRWFERGGAGHAFDRQYQSSHEGRSWSDDRLLGLLRIFENTRGVQAIRECREWHDPNRDTDYTDDIVDDLASGKLVILDQALGDPVMNEQSAERIMSAIFTRQQQRFTNPQEEPDGSLRGPDPVIVYVEEAHTLLPRGSDDDIRNVWARTAKEGAKFNIGLVYSTQEPSSIQRNILKNTENWFLSHLNSTGETRELDQYNDFADFTASIRRVKEVGFLKVRMLSSPYTLPVQIDRFTATDAGSLMPYRDEFARGDSLWRLVESESVREFQGTIRRGGPEETSEPPRTLMPRRDQNTITRIIVIDGSTVTGDVRSGYPGAEAALLQLAAVIIDVDALRKIAPGSIPRPSAIRDIEDCTTLDAVLPGKNVVRRDVDDDTPKQFFRYTIHEMLAGKRVDSDHETLIETMRAITSSRESFQCPAEDCGETVSTLEGVGECPCARREVVFEADSLRLHERFEDYGSSAEAYTGARAVVEHLAMINIMRFFERRGWWDAFRTTAFVMDGPLAIFGMPAWLKRHLQAEVRRLHSESLARGGPGVMLFGVEKSGMFLEHLRALDRSDDEGPRARIDAGASLAPDRKYVHRHIALRPLGAKPHGDVTDYGRRVMYKNRLGQHSVVMTPIVNAQGEDRDCVEEAAYPRLGEVLDVMDEFSTYLYEDGFAPLVRAHAHAAIPLKAGLGLLTDLFADE